MKNTDQYAQQTLSVIILTLTLLLLIITPGQGHAAPFPLEITNIKPAGTSSPAISANNRIFRAYPGIEYNIRAAVIGGMYPFQYALTNAPSGMTIDPATGEISWPNPQSNSGTITLRVTDSENTTVSSSWSITVSSTGFVFLNSAYNGTETGSITQPYSSLSNLLTNVGSSTAIVYVRAGTYKVFEFQPYSGGSGDMLLGNDGTKKTPLIWLGYPGEKAIIAGASGIQLRPSGSIYVDNLTFSGFTNKAIQAWGGSHYQTYRRSTFVTLIPNQTLNENMGFIEFGSAPSTPGRFSVIQDCEFSNFQSSSAIGSLYDADKMLIENNYIHDDIAGGSYSDLRNGISAKYRTDQLTVRGNKIVMNDGWPFGRGNTNGSMENAVGVDISFNYFENKSGNLVHEFQGVSTESPALSRSDFYYYRNTAKGKMMWTRLNGASCPTGPIYISDNIMVNNGTAFDWHLVNDFITYHGTLTSNSPQKCLAGSGDLRGLTAAGILTESGLLTSNYQSYLGIAGWQLPDGSTPVHRIDTPNLTEPASISPPKDFKKL